MLKVQIQRLDPDIPLPAYATEGSAGMDLCAAVPEPLEIHPGDIVLVPTGIAIALPPGYEAQVRSRSGLALRYGVFALNAPGTIDSDYRGEIKVILAHIGKDVFVVEWGARIAQLVIAQYAKVHWEEVAQLPPTLRGEGGFGSTGV